MAASPVLSLQKAFYDTLKGDVFQAACGVAVGIYDHVPAKAEAPYIIISNIQNDGGSAQRYNPANMHASIMVWSTKPGKVELHTIADAVQTFLAPPSTIPPTPPFALEGHRLVTWRHLQTIPSDDPDGISTKAEVKLFFLTNPLS